VSEAISRPVVQSLLALLRVRNTHPAFGGTFTIEPSPADRLVLRWTTDGEWLRLDADLSRMCARITCGRGASSGVRAWSSEVEA
jgi:sucrose phosphorylase